VFSPDGQRLAYAAVKGNSVFVVVDGVEERHYDDIISGSIAFSPDGKHLTYAAIQDKRALLVVDGKEVREHDIIFDRENRLFYIANRGIGIIHGGRLLQELDAGTLGSRLRRTLELDVRDRAKAIEFLAGKGYSPEQADGSIIHLSGSRACDNPELVNAELVREGLAPTRLGVV
jgi:hypothetical protein